MMKTQRIPQHDVGVLNGTIGTRPAREPVSALALIGIHACRVAFVRLIRCDPQMKVGKPRPLLWKVVWTEKRDGVGFWL